MSEYGITKDNLLAQFPVALSYDKSIKALGEAVAQILADHVADAESVDIYQSIDDLPEDLLDLLAYDFKVEWWDYNYTLEEKRRLLKNSWKIHRFVGTPAAVTWAIDSIFGNGKVEEWYEYNGSPHHFRAFCENDGTYRPVTDLSEFYRLVNIVKRRSSWLDDVIIGTDMGIYDHYTGGRACVTARLCVPETPDDLSMEQQSTRGGRSAMTLRTAVPVAS